MKNILDIRKSRQISPDDMMADVEFAEEAYERLADELANPPTLINADGQEAMWEPPDSIEDLSDSELEQAIWQSARIYGHFAKIAEAANGLLKVIKEEVDNLAVILCDQFYPGILKADIKSTLARDADYWRASSLKKRLTYVHSTAEGNRKEWSKLSDRLSRIVELRKDSHLPKSGNSSRRVPKNPKKIFKRDK
jgi:hypothetical protein